LIDLLIERISQDELDACFVTGEAQEFGLVGCDEEVDYLYLLRFSFGIALNVCTGRENLDILKKCSYDGARTCVATGGCAGDENINVHTGSYKAGDADDLVHLDRGRSHPLGNRSGESSSRAGSRKAALLDGFTQVKIGDDSPTYDVFASKNCAFRDGTCDLYCGEIGVAKNRSELDVRGGRYDTGGGLLSASQTAPNQAKDQVTASGGYDECNQ
jgi:hypothetical protein